MNCDLMIITYQFPYGTGEDFLSLELKYISFFFNQILIIPSRSFISSKWWKNVNKKNKKDVPDNCIVLTPDKNIMYDRLGSVLLIPSILHNAKYTIPIGSNIVKVLYEITKEAVQTYLFISGVSRLVKRNKNIKIFYTYWKGVPTYSLLLLRTKIPLRGKVITRTHGGDLYYNLPNIPSRPYDNYIAKHIDIISTISESGATHLIEHGFDRVNIIVSRLGINLPDNVTKPSVDGILRIVSCSSIIPIKRIHLLASALSILKKAFIWTHFGDGPLMEEVKKITKKISEFSTVNLMGWVSNEYIINYYQSNPVDVFINVSASEGVPVSIMESLAAGIPCIATDVGGTSEIVDNNVGLLLHPECTYYEIMNCIDIELSDTKKWSKKRINARKRADEMCNAKKNYHGFADLLKKI